MKAIIVYNIPCKIGLVRQPPEIKEELLRSIRLFDALSAR